MLTLLKYIVLAAEGECKVNNCSANHTICLISRNGSHVCICENNYSGDPNVECLRKYYFTTVFKGVYFEY